MSEVCRCGHVRTDHGLLSGRCYASVPPYPHPLIPFHLADMCPCGRFRP